MKTILRNAFKMFQYKRYKKKLAYLGSNVIISKNFYALIPENLSIHDNVYIGPSAWILSHAEVIIHSGVIIGPRVKIYTGNHNYDSDKAIPYDNEIITKPVVIHENVWIGGDVIILPGVKIGEGVIIGAGSVVTKNIAPYLVVGGNPAIKLKERNEKLYLKLKAENKIYLALKKQGIF